MKRIKKSECKHEIMWTGQQFHINGKHPTLKQQKCMNCNKTLEKLFQQAFEEGFKKSHDLFCILLTCDTEHKPLYKKFDFKKILNERSVLVGTVKKLKSFISSELLKQKEERDDFAYGKGVLDERKRIKKKIKGMKMLSPEENEFDDLPRKMVFGGGQLNMHQRILRVLEELGK